MIFKTEAECEFLRGWILAVSTIFHRTGDDVACYGALREAGIAWEDLAEFDLPSFDMEHMTRIFWHEGGLFETLGKGELTLSEYLATMEAE